jgi:hypothetical protein
MLGIVSSFVGGFFWSLIQYHRLAHRHCQPQRTVGLRAAHNSRICVPPEWLPHTRPAAQIESSLLSSLSSGSPGFLRRRLGRRYGRRERCLGS